MKLCLYCAEELEDGAKFCSKCGKPQSKKMPVKEPEKAVKKSTPSKKPAEKKTAKKPAATSSGKVSTTKTGSAKKEVGRKAAPAKKKHLPVKKPAKTAETWREKVNEVYEITAQDNCGECGCKTCYSFALQAASPKNPMEISDCPYIET